MNDGHFLDILAFFGSFWLSVTIITVTALAFSYWRKKRTLEQGHELVVQMLHNKMTAGEIEQVLLAWNGNRLVTRKLLAEKKAVS